MGRRVRGVGLGIAARGLGLVDRVTRIAGQDARQRLGLAIRSGEEVGRGMLFELRRGGGLVTIG